MENASKALIIAGAILLSILIIGLGMAVYNNANSATGSADMSSQEINAHNSQFSSYEGKQKGTQVRTLLNLIAKNNEDYEDRQIKVSWTLSGKSGEAANRLSNETDAAKIRDAMNDLKTTSSYTITYTYNGEGGVIDTCTIAPYAST